MHQTYSFGRISFDASDAIDEWFAMTYKSQHAEETEERDGNNGETDLFKELDFRNHKRRNIGASQGPVKKAIRMSMIHMMTKNVSGEGVRAMLSFDAMLTIPLPSCRRGLPTFDHMVQSTSLLSRCTF